MTFHLDQINCFKTILFYHCFIYSAMPDSNFSATTTVFQQLICISF